MARQAGGAVLQAVRAAAVAISPTDRALLAKFIEGDEAAFAALVTRHTGMVLGVCRRALHNAQDAEDACQAVFLILARKAGRQRWQSSIANWLYTTARRVAFKAARAAARRAKREARVTPAPSESPLDLMTGREAFAALDEELDKLPAIYREPLVLCYLEGLTRDETAARLGVPAATLKSQLERGRKKLGDALTKRGVALGAGLLAVAVTSPAGASPPRLVESILAAASGSAPAAVGELAKGVAVNGVINKAVLALAATVAVVALGLGFGLGALQPSAAGQPAEPGLPAQPRQADAELVARAEPAPPALGDDPTPGATYRGRVLGPDGKPVAGAKLSATLSWDYVVRPGVSAEYATTDADGRFEFTLPHRNFDGMSVAIVATSPKHGLGWIETRIDKVVDPENLTLRLVEDEPITGQVVDLQGKPVVGATLRVLQIRASPGEDLGPWDAAVKAKKGLSFQLDHQYLPRLLTASEVPVLAGKITTDADGRFKLSGIGRNRLVTLRIDGPTIASTKLHVLTRPGKTIEVPETSANFDYGEPGTVTTYYPGEFRHVAGPTIPIVGVVRDKDTKKPLSGVTVKSYKLAHNPLHGVDFIQTTTDADGRYRLVGLPVGEGNKIMLVPPDDQPYLPVHAEVPVGPGFDPVTIDFDLKRGVWIEGKVTDKQTGKPVRATVEYFSLYENPNLQDYPGFDGTIALDGTRLKATKEDGSYRVVGLPGPGLVAVRAHSGDYLRAPDRDDEYGVGGRGLSTSPYHLTHPTNYHALARVDPAKDGPTATRNVVLDPGETIKGALVGPDGKPVAGARGYGLTRDHGWERAPLETADFTIHNYNLRRPRAVLFRHVEKGLVGVMDPPKDAGQVVTVRLQPGATVTGRLLDTDGQPRPNVELDVSMQVSTDTWGGYSLPTKVKTDADGRFRVETLLPGYRYTLYDRGGRLEFGDGLKSGEVKDLGDVRLKLYQ
jgi:RNA polymerase sigma factor (sigma-70 family)